MGFQRWLEADPQNAKAFEGMTEIWDAVGGTKVGRFPRVNALQPNAHRRIFAQAAAVLLTCGAIGVAVYNLVRNPVYVTAIGERRTVDLQDGSEVSINSNTRLVVMYGKSERRVRLEKGEAFFNVSASRERPFIVMAGDQEVTALGTSFVVRHEAGRTAITLVEGKVTVAPTGGEDNDQAAHLLRPGERFTISARRTEQLDKPPAEALMAWRRGEVVLDHTPLADAAAEMNRYDKTAIVIDDPKVAALRVSGNYKTGDSEGFAQAVAAMYGLKAAERDGRIHLGK